MDRKGNIEIDSSAKIIRQKFPQIPLRDDLDIKLLVDLNCVACHTPMICVCTGDIGGPFFYNCHSGHACLNPGCHLIEYVLGEGSDSLGRNKMIFDPRKCLICDRELSPIEVQG